MQNFRFLQFSNRKNGLLLWKKIIGGQRKSINCFLSPLAGEKISDNMKQTLSRVLSKFHSSTLLLCQYIKSLYSLFISTLLNILHQRKALNFFIVNVSSIKLATVLKLWPVLQLSLHFCKE